MEEIQKLIPLQSEQTLGKGWMIPDDESNPSFMSRHLLPSQLISLFKDMLNKEIAAGNPDPQLRYLAWECEGWLEINTNYKRVDL